MKKTKLTRSLLAACSIVALSAVMYGCVHNGGDDAPATDMSGTPDPMPEPTPDPGPNDLEITQADAAAAAAAAMTASDNAAASAKSATEATMTLATLQTGADSNSDAMGGREAAMAARAAAAAATAASKGAAAASAAAAAATTGDAAEEAWRHAVAARDAAVAAEATAATMGAAAIEAAMTELHIVDNVKSLGDSTVDAKAGTLTDQDDGTTTGFIRSVSRDVDAITGVAFDQRGMEAQAPPDDTDNAADVAYVQAVAAASVDIGKVLDTSDDLARLTIITAREGTEDVRVFADLADNDNAGGRLDGVGLLADDINADETGVQTASVKSIGSYYMAGNTAETDNNVLDAMDSVDPTSDPVELFELTGTVTDGTDVPSYVRVTETRRDGTGAVTGRTYQAVDITAFAALDSPADGDNNPEQVQVTASIPVADDYSHIHFGVWAGLTVNEDGDNAGLAALGIGFVQNYDRSGETAAHVTGTATYSGDWVGVVRPMHSTSLGRENGSASLTANFSTDEFTGDLVGLAMLEGTLSGNTFAGTDAAVDHDDMDSSGDFKGEFSGAIYGPDGAEAAGVFSFDGGAAGAFVGAFGGRDDEQ